MIKKRYLALVPALFSISSLATAGDKLMFLEAGLSYSHAFYKDSVKPPESVTLATPGGATFDPSDHYPNNFWGGYLGMSLYSNCWMFNTRWDMYNSDSERHGSSGTNITFKPVRLSFTLDRVWGDIHDMSFGLGAGAVIENLNQGTFWSGTEIGAEDNHSLDGRTRIDPQLEGFVMKMVAPNVGIKLNVGYQFPAHNRTSNGDLNVNLGVNYAFSV